jgi:predicted CXXCH cytochrome family protein
MKILFRLTPLIALLWISSSSLVYAAENVALTKHNLTLNTNAVYTTDAAASVCVFCHSPHTETTGPAPLWNRGDDNTGYTMYSSPTMQMTAQAAPAGISLACLSCHDGVIALDQLINGPSQAYTPGGISQGWTFVGAGVGDVMPNGVTNIGKVLSGDHPISVKYDETLDTAFQPLVTVQAGTSVQLYGALEDQVECASCHNPHENDNPSFLRTATASALCTTCHIK